MIPWNYTYGYGGYPRCCASTIWPPMRWRKNNVFLCMAWLQMRDLGAILPAFDSELSSVLFLFHHKPDDGLKNARNRKNRVSARYYCNSSQLRLRFWPTHQIRNVARFSANILWNFQPWLQSKNCRLILGEKTWF